MKLLAKDPTQRYASAEDLRSDLRRFLEGSPVLAAGLAAAGAGAVAGAAMGGAADATTVVPAAAAAGGGGMDVGPPTTATNYVGPPERKRTGMWVAIVIAVLAIVGLALFFIGSNMGKSTEKVQVPDVTSLSQTDATNKLQEAGFKISVKNVANDTVPVDQVFEQSPKGGVDADKGSTVQITVSSGIGDVTVPSVVDLTEAAAESLLKSNNLIAQVQTASSDTVAEGKVISQSPAANAKVAKNSVVTITVSSGPGDVSVPDVINQPEGVASNRLGQAGFSVNIVRQSSATVTSGNVISTNPAAGTKAAKGSQVTMVVSSGPEQVAVPNFAGDDWGEYKARLISAGLTGTAGTNCTADTKAVTSVNPTVGTMVNKGSTVTATCAP